jgi:RHS repeat-associated protein
MQSRIIGHPSLSSQKPSKITHMFWRRSCFGEEAIYYLYRYYDPRLQRWLCRDPISAVRGRHSSSRWAANSLPHIECFPYTFAASDPINRFDIFGLLTLQQVTDVLWNGRPAGVNDNISTELMLCLFLKESSFNENAVNPRTGASGIAQILPGTADDIQDRVAPRMGGSDPFDGLEPGERLRDHLNEPEASVFAAFIYLDDRIRETGSVEAGVRAYGPNGDKVLSCEKCLKSCPRIVGNPDTGGARIPDPGAIQGCLNQIHP